MTNTEIAIGKINKLRGELSGLFIDNEALKNRTDNVLLTLENGLRHFAGIQLTAPESSFVPSSLKDALQKQTSEHSPITEAILSPKDADKEALRKEAEKAYQSFLERDNKDILESTEDLVIRAVAKKAGIDVTSTIPEKIDFTFIDHIKAAIIKKEAIEVAKGILNQEPADNVEVKTETTNKATRRGK